MKSFSTLLICLFALQAWSQSPTMSLVIEEQTIPEPAFSTIQNEIGGTPISYRLYAEIPENYELQFIYGIGEANSMHIETEGGLFYQSPLGGPTTLDVDADLFPTFPEAAYDSWLTIGADQLDNNQIFVLPDPIVFAEWETGDNLLIDDDFGAGIYMTTFFSNPQNTPDENGRILVGQFTVTASVSGCFSVQLRRLNLDGTIFDPEGPETNETLVFNGQCFNSADPINTCVADLDNSGNILINDVLLLIQNYGCTSDCTADLDGNDTVDTNDLLIMLASFGQPCPPLE
ncbi:MAG: hypothetical protein ACI898_001596 [Flavobacteriales bacterium]|jgi:hypothetical protein